MTITYQVKRGIYVNITNRCPCACTFCLRRNGPGVYGSGPLWLEREPSVAEIEESIAGWDLDHFDEIVFCGYGEPTERLADLLEVAGWIKARRPGMRVRVNTNGLSDLALLLCGLFSSCGERGSSLVAVQELLIVVASLLWSTGSRALGL